MDTRLQRLAARIMVAKTGLSAAFSSISRGITLVRRGSSSKDYTRLVCAPGCGAGWDPEDGRQHTEVVLEAGNRGGVIPGEGGGESVRGGARGVHGGRVADRVELGQHLAGGLIRGLGPDVGQVVPVRPTSAAGLPEQFLRGD
jgi:hypothetical protein